MSLEYIHKYTIQDNPSVPNTKMLVKDGQVCKCHRVPMVLIPNRLANSVDPIQEPCNTNCTRALIAVDDETNKLVFIQTCEVQAQKFPLENAEAKPKVQML
jgi:hypothetical protein